MSIRYYNICEVICLNFLNNFIIFVKNNYSESEAEYEEYWGC